MPVVFVHGVSTRESPQYWGSVEARDAFLRQLTLAAVVADPGGVTILNPYWGALGGKLAWGGRSLPSGDVESLGAADHVAAAAVAAALPAPPADSDATVLEVARRSLVEAVDLLWGLAAHELDAAAAGPFADLAGRATRYALANPRPAWLDEVANDRQLLNRLESEIERWEGQGAPGGGEREVEWESLGFGEVWDRVREAADRAAGAAGRAAGQLFVSAARANVNAQAALFLGDVFVYLKERGSREAPGPIVQTVAAALDQALAARAADDAKLMVIAHSMGGNVTYDLLSHFRPDIQCDLFVTVGSQVALFEELKLFVESRADFPANPADPAQRVPKPANVGAWINVFDDNDVLGYAAEGVFSGATDFRFVTGEGVRASHSAYFVRPSFYTRLGERIRSALG